jgi:hypothetical protein
MPTSTTPSIAALKRAIDIAEQIEKLQSQLTALVGGSAPAVSSPRTATSAPAPAKRGKRGKRTMSPEARERIAAAQRARWAKSKGAKTPAAAPAAAKAAKPAKKKGGLTPAGRARLAAAMKARWAARKKGAPAPNSGKK